MVSGYFLGLVRKAELARVVGGVQAAHRQEIGDEAPVGRGRGPAGPRPLTASAMAFSKEIGHVSADLPSHFLPPTVKHHTEQAMLGVSVRFVRRPGFRLGDDAMTIFNETRSAIRALGAAITLRTQPLTSAEALQHAIIAGSPDRRIAGSPDRRIAGSPDRRIAGSPDRRIAGSPDRRIAGSPFLHLHGVVS